MSVYVYCDTCHRVVKLKCGKWASGLFQLPKTWWADYEHQWCSKKCKEGKHEKDD